MAKDENATRRELALEIAKDLGSFSAELVKDLKAATPKRTGRARAGWSVTTPVSPDKYNRVLTQNSVPYIESLNEGSSKQAPAGYIEDTIDKTLGKYNK